MLSAKTRAPQAELATLAEKPKRSAQPPEDHAFNPLWARLALGLQPKLTVSTLDDSYEREADRVAERVDDMAPTTPLADTLTPLVPCPSPHSKGNLEPAADFESRLGAGSGGSPLPAGTREFMELHFGADFSRVRLHTGSEAVQLSRAIGAQAFAHGWDVYLGEGKNDLESSAGKQLLAHELTHVIQQAGSPPRQNGLARASEAGVIARSKVHTDKDLFDMMQKFRSKNDQLTEAQQNKIFWAVKKSTDSDEVAYKFFDYYSGYLGAGHQILLMTAAEEAAARKSGTLANTPSGGDTKLRSDVLTMPDETLGPLLLHEFAHTGHHTNWGGAYDFEEGQAYGVEYHYAERTGDTARMARIITIISAAAARWGASQGAAVQQNFKVTYALMHALADLTKSGSSTLPPLAGKDGKDGRAMAAEFVSDFRDLSRDLTALWEHIRTHLTSFVVPVI